MDLDHALKQFDLVEANLTKLEKVLDRMTAKFKFPTHLDLTPRLAPRCSTTLIVAEPSAITLPSS